MDRSLVDSYSSEIRNYIETNDYGAVRCDFEELSRLYRQELREQTTDYTAEFENEKSVKYNFGMAIEKAVTEETSDLIGKPDIEQIVRETVDSGGYDYLRDDSMRTVKEGAYSWRYLGQELESIANRKVKPDQPDRPEQ